MTEFHINIIIITVLTLMSAFFSGSETALFSLGKSDLHRFSHSRNPFETAIARTMTRPHNILITILIGNLFVNIAISAIATNILLMRWPESGHYISIAVVTPLVILFCEIVPKILALNSYEKFSKRSWPMLSFFHFLFSPLRFFLLVITEGIISIFGLKMSHSVLTVEELDMIIHAGEKEGLLDTQEKGFIKNVLRFSQKEAMNIMYPRNQAVFIHQEATIHEAMEICVNRKVIRIPVYGDNIDHVTGMIDCRELMPAFMGYRTSRTIKRYIHPIYFFPATRELNDLLNDFLNKRIEMAMLVDEYGGIAGVVTLSAILKEILGKEINRSSSEYKSVVRRIDENHAIVSGDMQLHDFNEEFNTDYTSPNADTVAGLIIEKMGYFPVRGEEIRIDKLSFKVRSIKKNRILAIEVIR